MWPLLLPKESAQIPGILGRLRTGHLARSLEWQQGFPLPPVWPCKAAQPQNHSVCQGMLGFLMRWPLTSALPFSKRAPLVLALSASFSSCPLTNQPNKKNQTSMHSSCLGSLTGLMFYSATASSVLSQKLALHWWSLSTGCACCSWRRLLCEKAMMACSAADLRQLKPVPGAVILCQVVPTNSANRWPPVTVHWMCGCERPTDQTCFWCEDSPRIRLLSILLIEDEMPCILLPLHAVKPHNGLIPWRGCGACGACAKIHAYNSKGRWNLTFFLFLQCQPRCLLPNLGPCQRQNHRIQESVALTDPTDFIQTCYNLKQAMQECQLRFTSKESERVRVRTLKYYFACSEAVLEHPGPVQRQPLFSAAAKWLVSGVWDIAWDQLNFTDLNGQYTQK